MRTLSGFKNAEGLKIKEGSLLCYSGGGGDGAGELEKREFNDLFVCVS